MADITTQQIVDGLIDADWYWSRTALTFSIPGPGAAWTGYAADEEPFDPLFGVLNATQAAAFRLAITAWDALITTSFTETDDAIQPGDIRVAFTEMDRFSPGAAAYAYVPPFKGGTATAHSGDVWIDDDSNSETFAPGSYEYKTLLHELGHALGLKHSFEDGPAIPAEWDSRRYTVMSYDDPVDSRYVSFSLLGNGSLQSQPETVVASTPMLFDVIAIQSRYGADPTTALGADIYTFNASAPFFATLYDAGGVDTIDLSNLPRGSDLDLRVGAYSSINYFSAAAQAAYWKAQFPGFSSFIDGQVIRTTTYTWTDNFAIAPGTIVEQVRGSVGADTVTGNDSGNAIWGGAGDDRVTAGNGANFLRGEEGDDWIVGGNDTDDSHGNMGNDTVSGGDGGDWVVGGKDNDLLYGDGGHDVVWGNLGNDTCEGGDGDDQVRGGKDDDVVRGNAGNDWLSGDRGTDTITGGSGADIFHTFDGAGSDRATDFNAAEGDRVYLLPGTQFSVAQVGADTVVTVTGVEGGQLTLVGVQMSTLPEGWIFGA